MMRPSNDLPVVYLCRDTIDLRFCPEQFYGLPWSRSWGDFGGHGHSHFFPQLDWRQWCWCCVVRIGHIPSFEKRSVGSRLTRRGIGLQSCHDLSSAVAIRLNRNVGAIRLISRSCFERGMRRFKSLRQGQRFVAAHAAVFNLFNLGRYLVRAQRYRDLRMSALAEWIRAVA